MVPSTANNRFSASFRMNKSQGKFGPYHTGWDTYTTWRGSKQVSGHLTYTTDPNVEDKLDLNLDTRSCEPILVEDYPYVKRIGTAPTGEWNILNDDDIAKTKFDGRKFEVDFLPGREFKKLTFDTKNGKLKIKDQNDWIFADWKTEARVERKSP